MAKSLFRPVMVVTDGLTSFAASKYASVHESVVTGGGSASASAKLPQFRAVNRVPMLADRYADVHCRVHSVVLRLAQVPIDNQGI